MSVELRIDGDVTVCDWGAIDHPDPHPSRGEVGPLMLIGRRYFDKLVSEGPHERADGGTDSAQRIVADPHQPPPYAPMVRRFVHLDYDRRYTWELFDAHWWDDEGESLYIGRWPD